MLSLSSCFAWFWLPSPGQGWHFVKKNVFSLYASLVKRGSFKDKVPHALTTSVFSFSLFHLSNKEDKTQQPGHPASGGSPQCPYKAHSHTQARHPDNAAMCTNRKNCRRPLHKLRHLNTLTTENPLECCKKQRKREAMKRIQPIRGRHEMVEIGEGPIIHWPKTAGEKMPSNQSTRPATPKMHF